MPPLARSVVLLFASWSYGPKNLAKRGPFVVSCKKTERPPDDSRVISWFWTTSKSQPGIFESTILASGCTPRGHSSPRSHSRSKGSSRLRPPPELGIEIKAVLVPWIIKLVSGDNIISREDGRSITINVFQGLKLSGEVSGKVAAGPLQGAPLRVRSSREQRFASSRVSDTSCKTTTQFFTSP